ncbi:hypothetical protein ABVT39_015924 [Epinephelus coioides]
MKLNSLPVLCLSLILFHTHFSLAKKGGGGSFGRSSYGSKKTSTPNRSNTNSNTGSRNNQGSSSQGGHPRQPNQGRHPQHPGRPGGYPVKGGYPRQSGYPAGGYQAGGYPARSGGYQYGAGYGGGYINHNPNNKVLSPHYAGSFGYGGYGSMGGSPFSRSVQGMSIYPSDKSRGFGNSAVQAAAGGSVAGMAMGYGLGRFQRPPFHFHNRQEEQHYNHYMYRTYGTKSTDANDYSRDYTYSKPDQTYDSYMDSCMKTMDLLPVAKKKTAVATTPKTTAHTSAPDTGTDSSPTETNSTAADNSSTSAPSAPRHLNPPVAIPVPPASQAVSSAEDSDTVSIVEIGYPALIEQMKARKCVERYMVYSEKYLKRVGSGVQGLEMGVQGLLALVTSTTLMLLNSNMFMLLR